MAEPDYQRLIELDGPGRFDRVCQLLAGVERSGSLNQAVKQLGLSYRHAWGLVRRAEERLGGKLLVRRVGGATGGGASLTEAAQELLARYQRLRREVQPRISDILAARPPLAAASAIADRDRPVLLASTIGPAEVGLLDALAAAFHADTGLWLRHVAAGTGQALGIAASGGADLVLTHAPELEAEFLAAGYGTELWALMRSDYVLVGPPTDPAGIGLAPGVVSALARLAASAAPFVSRGDRSGTHTRELALWAAAGVTPAPPWYSIFPGGGQGSMATLAHAGQQGAYTLVDRAAFVAAARSDVTVLHSGEPLLANPFSLILVNVHRFPHRNAPGARRFTGWATGPTGQALIADFGRAKHGVPLFLPAHPAQATP